MSRRRGLHRWRDGGGHRRHHGAAIVIGQRSITDTATAALSLITVGVLWRFKKLPEPVIVIVAAIAVIAVLVLCPLAHHA